MNSSPLVQKLWNYYNGPGLGWSLARSPAREHAGARVKPRLTLRDDGMILMSVQVEPNNPRPSRDTAQRGAVRL